MFWEPKELTVNVAVAVEDNVKLLTLATCQRFTLLMPNATWDVPTLCNMRNANVKVCFSFSFILFPTVSTLV